MKKLGYIIAAVATLAVAAPSIASAETIVVKRGHDHWHGPRAAFGMHRDHGWHRGWHHGGDKVIIVKHRGHGW